MRGEPYEAGGIRATVDATRAATDEVLLDGARRLAREALRSGTTTLEVKSGYGLTVEDEARLLTIAGTVADEVTFLGAHVVPAECADDPDGYVDLVCGAMLDACAPLASWCDVFCDRGAFDGPQARRVLTAARDRGMGLRVHANQLDHGPGAQLAAELGAASADHLTYLRAEDREALAAANVVATLLPVADLSTRSPWPDARALLDARVTVALATDCNPGTSFTTSMPIVVALAVTAMGMTPHEAVWAATAGGASALRRTDVGGLTVGARADLIAIDGPSSVHLAYRPGVPLIHTVIKIVARIARIKYVASPVSPVKKNEPTSNRLDTNERCRFSFVIVFLPVESRLAYRFCIFGDGCALGYFPCTLAKAVSELAGWH